MKKFFKIFGTILAIISCLFSIAIVIYSNNIKRLRYKEPLFYGMIFITYFLLLLISDDTRRSKRLLIFMVIAFAILFVLSLELVFSK